MEVQSTTFEPLDNNIYSLSLSQTFGEGREKERVSATKPFLPKPVEEPYRLSYQLYYRFGYQVVRDDAIRKGARPTPRKTECYEVHTQQSTARNYGRSPNAVILVGRGCVNF